MTQHCHCRNIAGNHLSEMSLINLIMSRRETFADIKVPCNGLLILETFSITRNNWNFGRMGFTFQTCFEYEDSN